jgi:hypothetical protein
MARKATTNTATTGAGTPDASQLGAEITTSLATADATAAQRIQDLQWVHQARVSQLTRTAAALKAQYGATDPGVVAAEAALSATQLTASRVGMAQLQTATAEPQVSANGWAIHGRVFNAQLQPVSGVTVFLVDASKTYQQAYGFAYTEDTGYFLLNYPGAEAATQDKSTPTKQATVTELLVAVVDAKAKPVYLGATDSRPPAGRASYQNIMLGNAPIGDPPASIRKVAIPKPGKKKES